VSKRERFEQWCRKKGVDPRGKLGAEYWEVWEGATSSWEKEVGAILDNIPGAIRVREGGGMENLAASLAVTVAKLVRPHEEALPSDPVRSPLKGENPLQALIEDAQRAADVLSTIYAEYQRNIGPFASQAQNANAHLGASIRKVQKLLATPPPWWHCDKHGDFNAMVAVGCPDCVRELRSGMREIAAHDLNNLPVQIARELIGIPK
jgi:hypothetical protein